MGAALEWVTDTVLSMLPGSGASPAVLLFLLAQYVRDGREDVRDAVEAGLARGLMTAAAERDPRTRCRWLGVFAEACTVSDDGRIAEAVQTGLAPAIDDLERFVADYYEPGEGISDGAASDYVQSGLALLCAFELTGRVQYSMLAEELIQLARRRWWSEDRGMFDVDFRTNCDAAQLVCRLASLRGDPEYTARAVGADAAAYERDAARLMARLEPQHRNHPADAAEYGLALHCWFALNQHPN